MNIFLLAVMMAGATEAQPAAEPFVRTCASAGERLWGRSLCAPVVVVDPATGEYHTTETPPAALPPMRANTAFDWDGERWVMLLEPLPTDPARRAALFFHEAWHAHQEALGFPSNNAVAAHLDQAVPRYLIRLEWKALSEALQSRGSRRTAHIAQALAFRARRLGGDRSAADAEREQMRHEGLAAYTGAALSGDPERLALEELREAANRATLSRSFAYASGPAWGLLLDDLRPGWREELGGGADLPDLTRVAAAAVPRADDYGGTEILLEETLAQLERDILLRAALHATTEARALRLPLGQMNMDFDPNRVTAAPDGASLYHRITLSDRWGRIRIESSSLRIAPDFSAAFAPWPLTMPDRLELAPGWRVEEKPAGGAELIPPETE